MKTQNAINVKTTSNVGWFQNQVIKFENARFFWMAVYLTAQSCIGSIAAGLLLANNANVVLLCTCAALTMASNSVFIAQGSGKVCLITLYLSVLLNVIIIVTNI